tara:strand:- start:914 stop:1711 length:798 start_codon:yes stop_codon:yes gene_type:complete
MALSQRKKMNLNLNSKRVLITGASRGIGAAIANEFLTEKSKVCIVSRGSEDLYKLEKLFTKQFGAENIMCEECDCTKKSSLENLKENIKKNWNGIDIVIVNVGDGRSVDDALPSDNDWKTTWDNNFESSINTVRSFLPMLKESKGNIIFISSIAGIEAIGAPVDYSTAKAAVIALAKNMSKKLAKDVRVNVIAPGNILFEGGVWDQKIQKNPNKIQKLINTTVPMQRFGTPQDIAAAVVFLCSKKASFITGTVLTIDGGQTSSVL